VKAYGVVDEVVEDRVQLGLLADERNIRRKRELDRGPSASGLKLLRDALQHAADVHELCAASRSATRAA
jgi:hypothetical protein